MCVCIFINSPLKVNLTLHIYNLIFIYSFSKNLLSYKIHITLMLIINYICMNYVLSIGYNHIKTKRYKCLQKDKLCFLQKRNINIYKKNYKRINYLTKDI